MRSIVFPAGAFLVLCVLCTGCKGTVTNKTDPAPSQPQPAPTAPTPTTEPVVPKDTGAAVVGKIEDTGAYIKVVTETLATIKDKTSAEEAAPKLQVAGEKLKKHLLSMESKYPGVAKDVTKIMPAMSPAELGKFAKVLSDQATEMQRVAKVEGGPEAIKAFQDAAK